MLKNKGCHIGLVFLFLLLLNQKRTEVRGQRNTFDESKSTSKDDFSGSSYYQGVDENAGDDFSTLSHIPETSFNCSDMENGYYADTEAGCRVFHICNNGLKVSFLCPYGTKFQQSELICEWGFKVNCSLAPLYYEESAERFNFDSQRRKESRRVTESATRSTTYYQTHKNTQKPVDHQPRRKNLGTIIIPDVDDGINSQNISPKYSLFAATTARSFPQDGYNRVSADKPLKRKKVEQSSERRGKEYFSSSEESQVPEESGSFLKSRFNTITASPKSVERNSYPNHKNSYSEIRQPEVNRKGYSKLPKESFYGSSVGPEALSTVPVFPVDTSVTQLPFDTTDLYKNNHNYGKNEVKSSENESKPDSVRNTYQDSSKTDSGRYLPESKVIYLKTTTQTSTISENTNRVNELPKILESPSLDFNIKSISVLNSEDNRGSTTEVYSPSLTTTVTSDSYSSTSGQTGNFELNSVSTRLGKSRKGFDPTESSIGTTTDHSFNVAYTTLPPRGFSHPSKSSSIRTSVSGPKHSELDRRNYQSTTENYLYNFATSTFPTPTVSTVSPKITENNMKKIITSLIKEAEARLQNQQEEYFATHRPGLDVPPSVSPKTLHSLALYFANAADENHLHPEEDYMHLNLTKAEEKAVIEMLFTQATRIGYESLFNEIENTSEPSTITTLEESGATTASFSTTDSEGNDYPPQNTSVRELARLFTSALSSYLHDPESFRKTLQSVRPTAPPEEGKTETSLEDEEVLNFSDSEPNSGKYTVKKSEGNRQPVTEVAETSFSTQRSGDFDYSSVTKIVSSTPKPFTVTSEQSKPTLGFILAYDTNELQRATDSDNSIDDNGERLFTADSQSSVSHNAFNNRQYHNKKNNEDKNLDSLIYSQSPDTTETVSFRPRATFNFVLDYKGEKLQTSTELPSDEYNSPTTETYSDVQSTLSWSKMDKLPENHWTTSKDVTKFLQSALSLDPLTVNYLTTLSNQVTTESISSEESEVSTESSVKGKGLNEMLLTLMKNNSSDHERVKLILKKLNLTEEEFKERMKEIEYNPVAKRLVLLLINNCNDNAKDIESTTTATTKRAGHDRENVFKSLVDESLTTDNEDTRALQLLNSLYVIASKFNK